MKNLLQFLFQNVRFVPRDAEADHMRDRGRAPHYVLRPHDEVHGLRRGDSGLAREAGGLTRHPLLQADLHHRGVASM